MSSPLQKTLLGLFAGLLVLPSPKPVSAESSRPNIVVIYTDDQGYGDVSVLNPDAKFETPNLDRLVKEGIAFTNAHSADSVCTPSRYALLTGRYPWRTTQKRGVMGAEGDCMIVDGRVTLASLLKEQGYQTGMVGKWHLGMDFPGVAGDRDWSQPIQNMPLDKGFDYYYGIPASLNYGVLAWFEGRHAKVPPTLLTSKKKNPRHVDYRIMPPYDPIPESTGEKRARLRGLEVAPDFIDNECLTRFTDKAIAWMDSKAEASKQGQPFFLYLPFTSPHYPVCPLPEFHGMGDAGAYGEFVIETDHRVGQILDFLASSGLDQNTLILFSSDNGPEKSWEGRIPQFGHDSRGGFRGGKRSVYEGGHRVPFMVRWPSGIAEPGRRCSDLIGQVDVLATVAEIVGASLPANGGEDSQSFAPVLTNPDYDHSRLPLINHGNSGAQYPYSVTESNWKLVLGGRDKVTELYDLATDPAEAKNIAAQHPEQVQRLTAQINQIIASGRTTPGPAQKNDTGYWPDLNWMTQEQFDELAETQQ
ncbi:sulfatase-like hydrolase/transferase [Aporhodopirellula aestuarii]|uniref:Sulfatase-like hydrolase/transferase n=1 Tax=Aporhodopirellula aestuarii TaxID=2950107 RepID=A0ABT0U314_9BACT|nr:sulfatase-like hydrolase/transferase [Aporhodopirellula aestuarii]MCM2371278.1 sulfatase-like hydrolase/transferase [Aporhodopirellula aestuarii]